jgi:hypothetical protein
MYHALCHSASLVQEPALILRHSRRHLEIFDEEPEATQHELDYYITLLFNITISMIFYGTQGDIDQALKRWEELPQRFEKSMSVQRKIKLELYDLELRVRLCCLEGRCDEISKLLPRISRASKAPHPYTPVFNEAISYYVAFALHASGNSRGALRWLMPVVNDENVEYRRYRLLLKSFLLRLVVLYDLGRHDVTETLCRQLTGFLRRQGKEKHPEDFVPASISALLKATTVSARRKILEEAAARLLENTCRPGRWTTAFDNLFLYSWFSAGAAQRSLRETVPGSLEAFREKVRRSLEE